MGSGTLPAVSAGDGHTCILQADGRMTCVGRQAQCNVPSNLGKVADVSAASSHTCVVLEGGRLICFGQNRQGQCDVPDDLGPVVSVSAGRDFTCAVRADLQLVCFGTGAPVTAVPEDLGPIQAVSAGSGHACVVKADGRLVCFGQCAEGQCYVPTDVGPVLAVSSGGFHTSAIKADGRLVCFGGDDEGQCRVPTDLGAVVAVSAGTFHTCAIKTTGQLVCFGRNREGQCDVPSDLGPVLSVSPALARRQRERGLKVVPGDAQRQDSCAPVLKALATSEACGLGHQAAKSAECQAGIRGTEESGASLVLSNELLDAFAPVKLQLNLYGRPEITQCRAWQELRLVHIISLGALREITKAGLGLRERIDALTLDLVGYTHEAASDTPFCYQEMQRQSRTDLVQSVRQNLPTHLVHEEEDAPLQQNLVLAHEDTEEFFLYLVSWLVHGMSCSSLAFLFQASVVAVPTSFAKLFPWWLQIMTAADEQEELHDPVPMVLGRTSKECESESENEACARFIAQMDLAGPEVLRVMPAVKAFQHCFLALRCAYGIDLLALSHQSETITDFWSHSWHGELWKKVLTLITIYNGRAAIGLGMFVAVVMMVLSLVLDLPGYDRHDMRETDWSAWSSWSGFLVTVLVMIFWRSQTRVFLDRTCISQSDDELKSNGILSLAGMLRRSDSMLILWDPTWTERLWCLFELAAFLKSREHGASQQDLTITPTLLGPIRIGTFLTATAGSLAFRMAPAVRPSVSRPQYYFLNTTFLTSVAVFVLGYVLAGILRRYFRDLDTMRRQLMSMSFDTALCACCTRGHDDSPGDPCDREILKQCMLIWFGSLESFDSTVRSEVLEVLMQDLEEVFSTRSTIAAYTPIMWAVMDYAVTFSRVEGHFWSNLLATLAGGLVLWLVGMPSLKSWLVLVCKLARARPGSWCREVMKNSLVALIVLSHLVSLWLVWTLAYGLQLSRAGVAGVSIVGTLLHAILFRCLGLVLTAIWPEGSHGLGPRV
ncbi:CCR3 [Symbiodinium sp. CCMP2456]|nr:CCR3 [Symbiodinium sp. CCMP2456]